MEVSVIIFFILAMLNPLIKVKYKQNPSVENLKYSSLANYT